MPQLYNGIGTWYLGKKNVHKSIGLCEACEQYGELKSYDTRLYFLFLLVPILPLGKKRIVNECPHCHKHYAVKLKEWEEQKASRLLSAVREYEQEPQSLEKAKQGLEVAISYQAPEEFALLAGIVRDNIPDNADLQALLASGYDYFEQYFEAEQAYRRALELEDKAEIHESFAVYLIQKQRPEEARPHLQHIVEQKAVSKLFYLTLLAEALQAIGEHQTALEVLADCTEVTAEVEQDPYFRKLKKISRKHASTRKRVVSSNIKGLVPGSKGSRDLTPVWTIAVLMLLVFGSYVGVAYYFGTARTVHLVNGISRAYDIDINGRRMALKPYHQRTCSVAEGEITVKVLDDSLAIEPQQCRIETSFWTRPFDYTTYVINPDKVALLYTERAIYEVNPTTLYDPRRKFKTGRFFYRFGGLDYSFSEFPETVELPNASSKVTKRRLAQFAPSSAQQALDIAKEQIGGEAYRQYICDNAWYQPHEQKYLSMLPQVLSDVECADFLKPRLSQRPVIYNWHASYQDAVLRSTPQYDMRSEYAKLVDKEPENSALLCLLARVSDLPRQEQLYLQAAKMENPHPQSHYMLGFSKLADGFFEESLDFAEKAVRKDPTNEVFQTLKQEAQLALRKYDDLLRALKNSEDFQQVAKKIRVLLHKGEAKKAQKQIAQYRQRLWAAMGTNSKWRKQLETSVIKPLHAIYQYSTGDLGSAQQTLSEIGRSGDGTGGFIAHFLGGKLQKASEVLLSGAADPYDHLTLSIAAATEGIDTLAQQHLNIAVESLRGASQPESIAAEVLAGMREMEAKEVCSLTIWPQQKRILMAAMAIRYPQQRQKYLAMARKLNYYSSFPYHFVERMTTE